jgi:4-hydroxythreonine-4-phosphate dehydrogenase
MNPRKPRIATVLGDPAGIGPELVGRLLADPASTAQADILLLADAGELQRGMELAGQRTTVQPIAGLDDADFTRAPPNTPLLIDFRGDTRGPFPRSVSSAEGGRYSLDTLALGLQAIQRGRADVMLFAPLNKHSLHLAGMRTPDELHWFAEQLDFHGPCASSTCSTGCGPRASRRTLRCVMWPRRSRPRVWRAASS